MKKHFLSLLALCLICHLSLAQIAITEFIANPNGTDSDNEWIELYNYSPTTQNIKDWRIKDDDSGDVLISSSNLFMGSGTYLILARNKTAFEALWLGGIANAKVIQVNFTNANTDDEIILADNAANEIWRLAYNGGLSTGKATFLEYDHSFCDPVTNWGSKGGTVINLSGNDAASGTLGYEKNNSTADSEVFTATNNDVGSPLAGDYSPLRYCGNITESGNGAWTRIPCECVRINDLLVENDYTTTDLSSLWRLEEVLTITSVNNRGLIHTDGANRLKTADFITFDNDRNLEEVKGFNSLTSIGILWLRDVGKLKRTSGFPVLKDMGSLLIWNSDNFEPLGLGGFPLVDSFGISIRQVKRLRDLGDFRPLPT